MAFGHHPGHLENARFRPGFKCPPPRGGTNGGAWGHGILGLVPSVYEAAGGDEGVLRLAHAWHARVLADEVVSHTSAMATTLSTPNAWLPTG